MLKEQMHANRNRVPIDLKEVFGDRFKITFDLAYDPKGRHGDKHDPWMMVIPCQFGTIYPNGGDELCVDMDGHAATANKVERLGGVELVQDGDRERTYRFKIDLFDVVAELVKPRKRRYFSKQHKAALAASNKEHRFKSRFSAAEIEPITPDEPST